MSKQTQLKAMQMIQNYTTEHPETAELIDMFIRMRKHPKSSVKISVGVETEEGFISHLTSNLRFPKIKFSLWENEPMILVQNHFETIASINISGCSNLHSERVVFDAIYHTEKETYIIKTADDLCYKITAIFENRIDNTSSEIE